MSAIEEMSSMMANSAQYADEADQITGQVNEESKSGTRTMEEMVSSMESIEDSNRMLNKIAEIIDQISEKTHVINDIVFKTQLLSFNASIEAARAGQYGKGFAVVAEEVGKLAESSGMAAKEISNLLGDSKKQVDTILTDTLARVRDGREVSNNAMETFNSIAQSIGTVSQKVRDIALAMKEQDQGVMQTTSAMKQMDAAAQQNNSIAQQTSGLATGIETQSEQMLNLVSDFAQVINGARAAAGIDQALQLEAPVPAPQQPVASGPAEGALSDAIHKLTKKESPVDSASISADDDSFKRAG